MKLIYAQYAQMKKDLRTIEHSLGRELKEDKERLKSKPQFTLICNGLGISVSYGYQLVDKYTMSLKHPELINMSPKEFTKIKATLKGNK